jgi:hypothetical protein
MMPPQTVNGAAAPSGGYSGPAAVGSAAAYTAQLTQANNAGHHQHVIFIRCVIRKSAADVYSLIEIDIAYLVPSHNNSSKRVRI